MTQENDTTTELCSGYQGLGGGAHQQAFCNSARIALLATIFLNSGYRYMKKCDAKLIPATIIAIKAILTPILYLFILFIHIFAF